MNNNGFTKRNVFIGDVQISEDLTCGDMVCQEMTLTGDINLDNKDIIGVDNLEVKTINGGAILSNPLTATLDLNGNSIINNPEIDGVIQKTQYITAVEEFGETQFSGGILVNGLISNPSEVLFINGSTITGAEADLVINGGVMGNISSTSSITTTSNMTCSTINADAINVPAVTTLQTKTQYQSIFTPTQSTVFTGIVNATTTLAVGTAQSGQTGYNLPLNRPLSAGFVMVTPASTGNTLVFQLAADPNKIQNLTATANQTNVAGSMTLTGNLSCATLNSKTPLYNPSIANLDMGGFTITNSPTITTLQNKTTNIDVLQTTPVQTYFNGLIIANTLTLGNAGSTYTYPNLRGNTGQGLRLLSDNSLGWFGTSSIRAYRVDTVPDFNTLTFASANVFVNFSTYLTTQSIVGDFSWQTTGARYEGAVTRPFLADFSVILLNENKDIVPTLTLTLVNITGTVDYSSQIFEHTHNRSRQWVLQATGTVSQNQIISARVRSSLVGSSTTIGSPQLNITLL